MIAVFASCLGGGFGCHPNKLPWPHDAEDMAFFRKITIENHVVFAGRKTAEGLPHLKMRELFVVSDSGKLEVENNRVAGVFSYQKFLDTADRLPGAVIGGATLLTPAVLDQCTHVYHTVFLDVYPSDVKLLEETLAWLGRNLPNSKIIKQTDKFLIREYSNLSEGKSRIIRNV